MTTTTTNLRERSLCVDIRVCRDGGRAKVRTEEGGRSVKTKA